MGKVEILPYTTQEPITMIGRLSAICVGAKTDDEERNYKRGLECLKSEHGRTFEFPDIYMEISGYSARVIREWYTHIGGAPTRLQESTRYVDESSFRYVTPQSIERIPEAKVAYDDAMRQIGLAIRALSELGVPREDANMLLPLGMQTRIVDKRNLRSLIDMSHQRLCTRAYREYRELFMDIYHALCDYSPEWRYVCERYFVPKCEYLGVCKEKKSCGRVDHQSKDPSAEA